MINCQGLAPETIADFKARGVIFDDTSGERSLTYQSSYFTYAEYLHRGWRPLSNVELGSISSS